MEGRQLVGVARRVSALVAIGVLLAVLVPATASARSGATIVRGIQHEFGSCQDAGVDGYLMDGTLEGCWVVDTFELKKTSSNGTMLAYGTEHFVGWLGGRFGTLRTTYTYTARFDGDVELHGRCHHPVDGGDGVLAGARGELSFTDVVDQQPPFYPYWGNIQLSRDVQAAAGSATAARSSTRSAHSVASAPC